RLQSENPITRSPDFRVLIFLALLLITIITTYLFATPPWWFPAGVSAHSAAIDRQFLTALWVLGALFIAGQFLLGLFLLRSHSRRKIASSRGSWPLEIAWTILIVCIFFWFNLAGNRLWSEIKLHQPEEDALQVEVTGTQFQWYFHYPCSDDKFGRASPQRFAKPEEENPVGIDPEDEADNDD